MLKSRVSGHWNYHWVSSSSIQPTLANVLLRKLRASALSCASLGAARPVANDFNVVAVRIPEETGEVVFVIRRSLESRALQHRRRSLGRGCIRDERERQIKSGAAPDVADREVDVVAYSLRHLTPRASPAAAEGDRQVHVLVRMHLP